MAGAHRLGPRRSLAALIAQLHHPLQRGHKRLADWPAGQLQRGPVDRGVLTTAVTMTHCQPALAIGIASVGVAGGGAGFFIDIRP